MAKSWLFVTTSLFKANLAQNIQDFKFLATHKILSWTQGDIWKKM